jgi:stage III sporulation protein SpoIIIAA
VLPSNLNRLLIIVVVLSMALTPLLNELGRVLAKMIDEFTEVKEVDADAQMQIAEAVEPIVIIGFGQLGQVSHRVSICYLICCFSYPVLVRMLGRN